MTAFFDRAFELIVGSEGKFSKDAHDPGNWTGAAVGKGVLKGTKYGISAGAYPDLDIENLSLEDAKALYLGDFWKRCRCDELQSWPWALLLFDAAVQHSPKRAVKFMQEALGVMPDGDFGARTMQALVSSNDRHLARFLARRGLLYAHNPQFEEDGMGWFTRLFVRAFDLMREPV